MYQYKPNEKIIDRAVEIWKRALLDTKYDNGDDSFQGGFASVLASMLPNNANEENLNKFGEYLKESLMNPIDNKDWYYTSIGVDYGPDQILAESAEKAGLKVQFPWKTNMHLYETHVSFSHGYNGEHINHYPLSNDKWLITSLKGSDINKVIEYVEGGKPIFKIE